MWVKPSSCEYKTMNLSASNKKISEFTVNFNSLTCAFFVNGVIFLLQDIKMLDKLCYEHSVISHTGYSYKRTIKCSRIYLQKNCRWHFSQTTGAWYYKVSLIQQNICFCFSFFLRQKLENSVISKYCLANAQ